MDKTISKKILLLNQTTLDSLVDMNAEKIIEHFTLAGLKIFGADYGFAWWKNKTDNFYTLAYKSPDLPYNPKLPRERGGNFQAEKNRAPVFVEVVLKENYEEEYDVSPYMKSYVIIPVTYKNNLYGSLVLCFKDGHIFTEEDRGLAVSLGNTTAQVITIHHLMEKEKEVRERVEMLKEVERLLEEEKSKIEFISNATHEIRTPLAIIRGNIDLAMINGPKNDKFLNTIFADINHEIEHLSLMISDLTLLISPGQKIKDKILFKKLNLSSILTHTVKRFLVIAKKKNISIKVKKLPKIFINGDKEYLEKLFANLIKNAITYGRQGGSIVISCTDKKNIAEINFTDNGIGIRKNDLPHIFKRFYMADKSHGSGLKNTGLGLAIAEWIVLAHGGSISAKSQKGKGSVFTVLLPILN